MPTKLYAIRPDGVAGELWVDVICAPGVGEQTSSSAAAASNAAERRDPRLRTKPEDR